MILLASLQGRYKACLRGNEPWTSAHDQDLVNHSCFDQLLMLKLKVYRFRLQQKDTERWYLTTQISAIKDI